MSSLRRASPPLLIAVALIIVLGLLALGLWLGGHPSDLPGFLRSAFVGNDETNVVDEAIGTVAHDYYRPIKTQSLVTSSIGGVVSSLHDPYSTYLPPSAFKAFDQPETFTGIGVSIQPHREGLKVVSVFNGSPAQHAGLRPGDVLVRSNGRNLRGVSLDRAVSLIEGPPGTRVHLQVMRDRKRRSVTITRETISRPVVASEMRVKNGKKIGWAYLATFSEGSAGQLAEAVHTLLKHGAKALVLDLRANGGGLVSEAQMVASLFLREGRVIVTTRGRAQPTIVLRARGGAIPASIPIAVLVDRDTASAAEIVTAALQDNHRAKVVGTHTFGKGVFQELEPLRNGGGLKITVGEYFTPSGRNLGGGGVNEGKGITPEIAMPEQKADSERALALALSSLAAELR